MVKVRKKHSKEYGFWKMCWDYKAISLNLLYKASNLKQITKEEYKMICGQNYADYIPVVEEDKAEDYYYTEE